jgi:hypothetical protein
MGEGKIFFKLNQAVSRLETHALACLNALEGLV